jgi:hypothetical protein
MIIVCITCEFGCNAPTFAPSRKIDSNEGSAPLNRDALFAGRSSAGGGFGVTYWRLSARSTWSVIFSPFLRTVSCTVSPGM